MKIVSIEDSKNPIEHILKKDLLIPCFVYKIPIEIPKNRNLNFVEETIYKLIQVDESLKQDIQRLSKMIGFYSEKKDEDKTKIVKLIVSKLEDLRLENNTKEDKSEVIVYQFYQEAYTNELLPIITKEINNFTFEEKSYKYKKDYNEYSIIKFKRDISSKRSIKALLINTYSKKFYKPNKTDIINTIFEHNRQRYMKYSNIDYKNFKIDAIGTPELVYLHVKLYMQSVESFIITNGFTNDFSSILKKMFENQHLELLNIFKSETRVDTQKNKNWDIDIPFENYIDRYPDVKVLIKRIEKQSLILKDNKSSKDKIKKAKDLFVQSLYDVIEKSFEYISKDLIETKDLKNRKLLIELAKSIGFKVDEKEILPIFKVYNKNNLQKYFSKSIFYKKDELYEIAIKYPNTLFILKTLFNFRNGLKHSQKEDILQKIDTDKLFKYKYIIYDIISIILKVKQKNKKETGLIAEESDIYFNNAYLDLENELSIDIVKQLPQEVKDNLIHINFILNSMDFKKNQFTIVKDTLNNLYSSLELILKLKIENIPENGSLNYIYNQIKNRDEFSKDDLKLIYKLIKLRGHGNPALKNTTKINENELKQLKIGCFKFIKKLYEEL